MLHKNKEGKIDIKERAANRSIGYAAPDCNNQYIRVYEGCYRAMEEGRDLDRRFCFVTDGLGVQFMR